MLRLLDRCNKAITNAFFENRGSQGSTRVEFFMYKNMLRNGIEVGTGEGETHFLIDISS